MHYRKHLMSSVQKQIAVRSAIALLASFSGCAWACGYESLTMHMAHCRFVANFKMKTPTPHTLAFVRLEKRVSLSECKSHQSIDCSDCSGEDYLDCEVYLEVLQSE
jgi:hypothetical protein